MAAQKASKNLAPSGIGLGVTIDWALASQMAGGALLAILNVHGALPKGIPLAGYVFGSLIAAAICVAWGEGLRSGRIWAWWLQMIVGVVVIIGGLVNLPGTIASAGHGDLWPLYPTAIIFGLFPFLLYRLVQPQTRDWIGHVAPAEARARHNNPLRWYLPVILGAAIGGFLVALAEALG